MQNKDKILTQQEVVELFENARKEVLEQLHYFRSEISEKQKKIKSEIENIHNTRKSKAKLTSQFHYSKGLEDCCLAIIKLVSKPKDKNELK